MIYCEEGNFVGTKIPKFCSSRKCNVVQYYGYFTAGCNKFYDDDWNSNEYLLCSNITGFKIEMLRKFELEILIAKMSFKEKADIYNDYHSYQP